MMKKMMLLGLAGLACFAGAAGISWFVLPEPMQNDKEKAVTEGRGDPSEMSNGSAGEEVVAIRSRPASAVQLYRTSALMDEQKQLLDRERKKIEEKKGRLVLMQKEMDIHKRELDGMYKLLQNKVSESQVAIQRMRDERDRLSAERQQREKEKDALNGRDTAQNPASSANVAKISDWLGADAAIAAEILEGLVSKGDIDLAVRTLSGIEDRNVSKILTAITDPSIREQLIRAKATAKSN